MAFSSVLNEYCDLLHCSNTVIAQRCGMSMSSLSRYRHGKRTPSDDSTVIRQLARGISELAREQGVVEASSQDEIDRALRASLSVAQPLGLGFSARLDSLMKLLGMRNSDIALPLHLDSSYISRIRRAERTPNNRERIARAAAITAAKICMENDVLDKVLGLIGKQEGLDDLQHLDLDQAGVLSHAIHAWLTGAHVMDSDISAVVDLLVKVDQGYFLDLFNRIEQASPYEGDVCLLEPDKVFYRGSDFMWKAELAFFDRAIKCGARHAMLSSDMPAMGLEIPGNAAEQYQESLADLVANGCDITVIHSLDRPLNEAVKSMEMWIPMYMTNRVTPLYLSGMESRLFCHSNSVCECCVVSGEAVRGHEAEGQYYMSTYPEDIEYYRRKMQFIKERSSSMLEVYRWDSPERMAKFERDEAERRARDDWRNVLKSRLHNSNVIWYPNDCLVFSLLKPVQINFVIRHPKFRYAVSHLP